MPQLALSSPQDRLGLRRRRWRPGGPTEAILRPMTRPSVAVRWGISPAVEITWALAIQAVPRFAGRACDCARDEQLRYLIPQPDHSSSSFLQEKNLPDRSYAVSARCFF